MTNTFAKRIPSVEFFFNNNPKCSVELEYFTKEKKWNLLNIPFTTVKCSNFNNVKMKMTVIFKRCNNRKGRNRCC